MNNKPQTNNKSNEKPIEIMNKELKKIEDARNNLGYNNYYSLKDNKIIYDLQLAKEKIKKKHKN